MSTAMTAIEDPRLVHSLPGRMRVHLAGWPREAHWAVEARLRQVRGVHSVQANPLTGNVLIHFDPTATDEQTLLAVVQTLKPVSISRGEILPSSPGVPQHQRCSRPAPGATLRLADDPHPAGRASIPQNGWLRLLRLEIVDLILRGVGVTVCLIRAESPLGLILIGTEVVHLFMEVIKRQSGSGPAPSGLASRPLATS